MDVAIVDGYCSHSVIVASRFLYKGSCVDRRIGGDGICSCFDRIAAAPAGIEGY